jgi:hypothetical protein
MELLDYASDTLSASAAALPSGLSVGANDASGGMGYFGHDSGQVFVYHFPFDVMAVLPTSLGSVTGLSSASNSLDKAYFAGSSLIESLDFATYAVQASASLPGTGHLGSSSSTFQYKGLA